ncbi:MAG: hypothetical protein ABRQ39_30555 [Candidatus Eremiobacterota bacterium]
MPEIIEDNDGDTPLDKTIGDKHEDIINIPSKVTARKVTACTVIREDPTNKLKEMNKKETDNIIKGCFITLATLSGLTMLIPIILFLLSVGFIVFVFLLASLNQPH